MARNDYHTSISKIVGALEFGAMLGCGGRTKFQLPKIGSWYNIMNFFTYQGICFVRLLNIISYVKPFCFSYEYHQLCIVAKLVWLIRRFCVPLYINERFTKFVYKITNPYNQIHKWRINAFVLTTNDKSRKEKDPLKLVVMNIILDANLALGKLLIEWW